MVSLRKCGQLADRLNRLCRLCRLRGVVVDCARCWWQGLLERVCRRQQLVVVM